jgi:hypothetical protein
MRFLWHILIVYLLAFAAVAETRSAYQGAFNILWASDISGEVRNIKAVDLDGSGRDNVVADAHISSSAGRSGSIIALDGSGDQVWMYRAGLLHDSKTGSDGHTIVGAAAFAEFVSPSGSGVWKKNTRSVPQIVFGQSVHLADLTNDGKKDAIVGTRYGSIAEVRAFDRSGNQLSSFRIKNIYAPYTFAAYDLTGNGVPEIITGGVRYSVNTVAGTMQEAFSREAEMFVTDLEGNLLWSDSFSSAVTAIELCDLDGDGKPEIIAGAIGSVSAYNSKGVKIWIADVAGRVNAIKCADIQNNGKNDVAVAAGRAYLLDNLGKQVWSYATSESYSLAVADLGGDGEWEIVVGSNVLRILDSDGKLLYLSDSYGKVLAIDVGDLNGDGFEEIVFGGSDRKIRALSTRLYSLEMSAARYFSLAEEAYSKGDMNLSRHYASLSADNYRLAGRDNHVFKAQELMSKAQNSMEGFRNYETAQEHLINKRYSEAGEYADRAIDSFRRLNDIRMMNEVSEFKTKALMRPEAGENLNKSIKAMQERDFENASTYSRRAKSAYEYLNEPAYAQMASEINDLANLYLEFYREIELVHSNLTYLDFGNASICLERAREKYNLLNDTLLEQDLQQTVTAFEAETSGDKTPLIVGGILLLLIVFLFIVFLALAIYYLKSKGMLGDSPSKGVRRYSPSDKDKPERRGGLTGLGGSSGGGSLIR